MKKILFTLATLLMAGSMFAGENYFYMDNITLTKDEAATGCKKVVDVKGHFDEAVSAWQVKFTLPEGVTIDMAAKGSDMTLTYWEQFTDPETLDAYYDEATYTPNLSPNADNTQFIVSVMDTKEFDPTTGQSYGICWRPGNYQQMWRVRLVFPAGFKGGDIVLNTQQSCGAKIMPGLTGCTLNPIDKTTEVRIKADKPEIAVNGDDYTKTVTITAEEDATIYYSTDGVNYQVYSAPIVFDEEGTYKVYAYAEGPGEGVERKSKSDVAESDEFTIKKKEAPAFEATADVTFNENVATLTYKANDPDAEVVVKVDGTPTTVTWTYNEETKAYTATYTVVKSDEPGEHSVTVELTVTPSENYTGEPASDSDTYTYKVNDELKGEIELGDVTDDGKVTVTYTPGEGDPENVELAVVVKDKDGNVVENAYADGVITLPDYGEYTVEVTAKADDYNDKPFDPETVKWEKKTAQKPTIERANLTDATCDIVITPDPATDGELTYDVDVAPLTKAATLTYERKDTDYPVHVTAQTLEGPTYQASAVADTTIIIPAKPAPNVYQTPDPKIEVTVDNENQKVIITVTGEGTVTAAVENANGTTNYTDPDGDGKIVIEIPFGEEADIANVTATALATVVPDGYDVISETPGTNKKENIDIPALPEKTAKPTITVEYGKATWDADGNLVEDGRYATITITNNDEGENVVIEYSLNGGETWLTYNPERPVTIAGEGTYTVMARAQAEGKRVSDPATETIKIDKATSVNELVNGKTVAGVRYFNMAGQEMQEANGITIVVTTYTDGTTSAVKVIK